MFDSPLKGDTSFSNLFFDSLQFLIRTQSTWIRMENALLCMLIATKPLASAKLFNLIFLFLLIYRVEKRSPIKRLWSKTANCRLVHSKERERLKERECKKRNFLLTVWSFWVVRSWDDQIVRLFETSKFKSFVQFFESALGFGWKASS